MTERLKDDPVTILRRAFPGMDPPDLQELANVALFQSYPDDTVLCREGAMEDNTLYVVVNGQVEVSKQFDKETEGVLHVLGPGDFFGEMALVLGSARTATVKARGPIRVLEIHQEDFQRVLERSAPLAIRLVLRVTDRLRDADEKRISELRSKNIELAQAYSVLERLDKNKSDFIGVAGHELRTPLTVITGYANMLKSNPLLEESEQTLELADGIISGINRMHGIVNSLLDIAKIDSQTLDVRQVPVSIAILIKNVHARFEEDLEERDLTFETVNLSSLPFVMGSSDLLFKAFFHLIANAIKYTPDGGRITVSGQVVTGDHGKEFVEVVVADTGIGIDLEDHELIFEKFYQTGELALHSSGVTKFKGGGPGLGLAIAKGAVVAHDGEIWVESKGHDEQQLPGSRFYVRLPLEPH